ncbi:tRNA (guanine-N(7)-)-methyltransferase non-catalytic subunit [Entamoeba marina]
MIGVNKQQTKLFAIYKNIVNIYDLPLQFKYSLQVSPDSNVVGACFLNDDSIITISEDKFIKHYSQTQELLHHIILPKKPTSVLEVDGGFLVSDKFGDVFRFKPNDLPTKEQDPNQLKDTVSNFIIISHFSLITSLAKTVKGNAIITTDRDEKVRITRYPRTDIIQALGYGFVEFVTSAVCGEINNIPFVVCGGGDGSLKIFNVVTGDEMVCHKFNLNDVVVINDVKIDNTTAHILIQIEKGKLYEMSMTLTTNAFEFVKITEITSDTKGSLYYNNDILYYSAEDELIIPQTNLTVTINKEGSSEKLSNEGILFESIRKTIAVQKRFVDLGEEEPEKRKKIE